MFSHEMEEEVYAGLCALGSSQEEVADTLRDLGYTGSPGSWTDCPLAQWANGEFEDFDCTMMVMNHTLFGLTEVGGKTFQVVMPEDCQDFVSKFDQGEHLDMCDDPYEAELVTL